VVACFVDVSKLRERIWAAALKATEAREIALWVGEPGLRDEWLRVARIWEELVCEYEELETARDQLNYGPARASKS